MLSAAPLQNGLMVACYKGFVDIVPLLQQCPYIDVNQQDKDGNTALMMAAQAGRHGTAHGTPWRVVCPSINLDMSCWESQGSQGM